MGDSIVRTLHGPAAPLSPTEERAGRTSRSRPSPVWLRLPRRPRLWFEILLVGVSYWTYSLVRNAVPEQKAAALHNARWIWDAEAALGLAIEKSVNHAVNSVSWLIVGMNYWYATLHFAVTILVLMWLFRRHPGRYAAIRLVLFATTGVALLGYYLYPLAPPRLMPGQGFVDTVLEHHTWGSLTSGYMASVSNQYAAMPSMHIGWSVWCGITLALLARRTWVKALGLIYPLLTLVVIVATANHFWLDAVGGLICLAFGYGVAFAWYGCLPHRLPRHVAPVRRTVVCSSAASPRTRTATGATRLVHRVMWRQDPPVPPASGRPDATAAAAPVPVGTAAAAPPASAPAHPAAVASPAPPPRETAPAGPRATARSQQRRPAP
ncbi:phosphatase PAP2 family protein [Streptomyces meridianus]|uniref:phosphatase PAP2 family protein n=1 Tax=Streptomyces meridianus TaxID=2938945 RepID=UPI00355777A6